MTTQFNLPPDTTGYSLIRFSVKKAADGDSFPRQIEAAERFCQDEVIHLDRSLHESDIRKLGMSGFTGKHVVNGPLRKFFAGIDAGTVKRGKALLLVSEWSRLTRQIPMGGDDKNPGALDLVRDLFRAGIGIVDLQDRTLYTLERYNADMAMQIGLQVKISMAYQYSANLRHNLNSVWRHRREAARAGHGKATNASPEWLTAVDGTWNAVERDGEPQSDGTRKRELWATVEPWKLRAIERIIADRHLGLGKHAIAVRLNTIPDPITGKVAPAFRGGKKGWHPSAVERLVKNKALIGIYQPRLADGSPDGEPIPAHYPRVLSDDDFWRAQWPEGKSAPRGRKAEGMSNLFQGMIKCGCGGSLVRDNKGGRHVYLVCVNSRRGLCGNKTRHPLALLEAETLRALSMFDYSRLLNRGNPHAERIAALEAEIAEFDATLKNMSDGFGGMDNAPAAFFQRAMRVEGEKKQKAAELETLRRNSRIAEADENSNTYAEFRRMIATLPTMADDDGRFQLRARIANELRRIVDSASVSDGTIVFQLRSTGNNRVELHATGSRINTLVWSRPTGTVRLEHDTFDLFAGKLAALIDAA